MADRAAEQQRRRHAPTHLDLGFDPVAAATLLAELPELGRCSRQQIGEVSHTVGVMYAGRIVEWGETADIFQNPMHPYTQTLMSAFPSVTGPKHELAMLGGEPPNLLNPPTGCRFHPRCPYATDVCRTDEPPKVEGSDTHWAACWHPLEA